MNWHKQARQQFGLLTTQQLVRSVWMGVLIGLVAGGGAIVFSWTIEFFTEHLLGGIAGYHPPQPAGEGGSLGAPPAHRWLFPVVLGGGGLVAGFLVFTLAPEAEGHGTDAAIDSFHNKGGRSRLRVIPVKLLASAITIGSGGAAGREGPTAQIGGGFGSWIADRFHLGMFERRRALAAGMGAGIAAIFRAPLGGAMMAAEVLYKHDLEADVILLGLISAIVGYSVYGAWAGFTPIFGGTDAFSFSHPQELFYYAILGVGCGLVGILYAKGFYSTIAIFHRIHIPRMLKPALGGFLVGLIGIVAPEAIHVGYGTIQVMMTEEGVRSFSPWLLLSLPFLRIVTTSLTVGSGGSGGIFGPGMVIGGVLGALAWRFGNGLPGFPAEPGPVVIICMIAAFGSIAHVPIAMLLMVGEMTGNLSLLAPAMVAVAVATLVVGDRSIYESQVGSRIDSPAHRHRFTYPLLPSMRAHLALRPIVRVGPDLSAARVSEVMAKANVDHAAVVDSGSHYLGEISQSAIERAPGKTTRELLTISPVVAEDTSLDIVLDNLGDSARRWLPVVDDQRRLQGAIDVRSVLRAYKEVAGPRIPRAPVLSDLPATDVPIVSANGTVALPLKDGPLPDGIRVVAVRRGNKSFAPDGETSLRPGDWVSVVIADGEVPSALELQADGLIVPMEG